jgi:ankyrin repeat protein
MDQTDTDQIILPHEIIGEIITKSDSVSRVVWCYVSGICYSYALKTVKHIGSYEAFLDACVDGDLLSVIRGPALYSHAGYALAAAIKNGHTELVAFLRQKTSFNNDSYSVEMACAKGYNDIVEQFKHIKLGYSQLMFKACRYGNLEIVKNYLPKISNNVAGLLYAAAQHKHNDIVSFLLEHREFSHREMLMVECVRGRMDKVLDMIGPDFLFDGLCLSAACTSGNIDLVKHLLSICADSVNLDMPLAAMCNDGNFQIAQLLVEHGAYITNDLTPLIVLSGNVDFVRFILKDDSINLNTLFSHACTIGNIEMLKIISTRGSVDWNEAIGHGCLHGHKHIVEYALKTTHWHWDWNLGLMNACRKGSIELMNFMLEKGANDYNNGLRGGCMSGNIVCIEEMVRLGAHNYDEGLHCACGSGQIDAAKLMIKYGGKYVNACKIYPELQNLEKWYLRSIGDVFK